MFAPLNPPPEDAAKEPTYREPTERQHRLLHPVVRRANEEDPRNEHHGEAKPHEEAPSSASGEPARRREHNDLGPRCIRVLTLVAHRSTSLKA